MHEATHIIFVVVKNRFIFQNGKDTNLRVLGPILILLQVIYFSLSEADFKVHLGEHDHTKSGESRVLVMGVKEYVFDENKRIIFLHCEYISGAMICLASSKTKEVHS